MKKYLGKIIICACAALALVAFFMMFAPAAGVKDADATYAGTKLIFGCKEEVLTKKITVFKFSFMNLLTVILTLAGVVFAVVSFFGKLGKNGKISGIISAACLLVAGVFWFCAVAFAQVGDGFKDLYGAVSGLIGKDVSAKDNLTLGAGAIVAGIFSLLSAIGMCANAFLIKK